MTLIRRTKERKGKIRWEGAASSIVYPWGSTRSLTALFGN
jgi:hypothetical protein